MVVLSVRQSFTVEDLSLVERRVRFHQVKVEERHRHSCDYVSDYVSDIDSCEKAGKTECNICTDFVSLEHFVTYIGHSDRTEKQAGISSWGGGVSLRKLFLVGDVLTFVVLKG